MIYFSQLVKIAGGQIHLLSEDEQVTHLITDSRKATLQHGAVFFAIRGERHDGHQYIRQLYKIGMRQFILEYIPDELPDLKDTNILIVSNTITALQQITAYHRHLFTFPVIGITGSNGKTIIKEWLFQILSRYEIVVKNPGSYNSQIGVPLSVWQMSPRHTLGIFEAGLSRPGEMVELQKIIDPEIGLFTNIGSAHDEGFSSREEKIVEKTKLFTSSKVLIYCKDHRSLDEHLQQYPNPRLSWGTSADADVVVIPGSASYTLNWKTKSFSLILPFNDKASVENCLHTVVLMMYLGYDQQQIQSGIDTLRTVPMRLELKEGINQCSIVDDTYNNDLAGIEISLHFLTHQHQKKNKTVILSDVLESGLPEEELVTRIADLLKKTNVNRFIGIGRVLAKYSAAFPAGSIFYTSVEQFLGSFIPDNFQQEVILVKGARALHFEDIVKQLQRKVHGTVMEIDLDALVHNLNLVKAKLNRKTKIMVMVKAFAYGSGSSEIANLLQFHQVDYLGVAYADEGIELRKNNIRLPIMVMNPSEESFEQLISYHLEPEIYSFKILHAFLAFTKGKNSRIHLKLDTGMHRLGFQETELETVIDLLKANPHLEVASVFSHLAGADESEHDSFSHKQAQVFLSCAKRLTAALGYTPLYHILNSSGILRLPEYQFDMVRLGIGLYGIDPTENGEEPVKPVATLKTIISQIKTIPKGESIGYGRRGVANSDMKVATIAIGYADGFNRAFSRGVGSVLIHGQLAPVVGNVCMDMTMVDVTVIPASEGDEVIIFGKELPIREVAKRINTIPYEILTSTSERVKRVFVAESL